MRKTPPETKQYCPSYNRRADMKKIILLIAILLLLPDISLADSLASRLSGRILLQVQRAGQAWYVYPANGQRYYLGRPSDAFNVMRQLGLGISEADFSGLDADQNILARVKGKIILRVQARGQAYYVNPADGQRHYLGRPSDAFNVMKNLALGITDQDLARIPAGKLTAAESASPAPINSPAPAQSALDQAAAAIRSGGKAEAQSYFIAALRQAVAYTLTALSEDSRLLLANILSGAKLASQTDTEKIYSTRAYFSLCGYDVPLNFTVKKQPDGSWLITNL